MKLQAFGNLLADEHRRTMLEYEALTSAFTDLNSLRPKADHVGAPRVTDVLGVARSIRESATMEVVDVLPAWFPEAEPTGHRVLRDQLPVLLRVVDRSVALIAESPVSGLLVRSDCARGMGQLFDLLWDLATAPVRHQVLRLMATGLDDAAVAAATGRSIRTVRAHVAAIMAELGAETRLAAGAEAARRGWL